MVALIAALLGQSNFPDVPMDHWAYRLHGQPMYEVHGEGPPIVAIPGGPGFSGRALWSFAYEMKDASQVILFNQQGTALPGGSATNPSSIGQLRLDETIKDLEAVRQHLGLKKWTVFGQSWGAIVAVKYAAEHPERVENLILTSIPAFEEEGYGALSANIEMRMPEDEMTDLRVRTAKAKTPAEAAEIQVFGVLPYYFWNPEHARRLGGRVPQGMFTGEVFRALSQELNNATFDGIKSKVKRWKGRTLIIHGLQDPCGSDKGYRLQLMIPQAKLVEFNRCGHFTWLEPQHTDSFFSEVRRFLRMAPRSHYLAWTTQSEFRLLEEKRYRDGWPFGYVPPEEPDR